MFEMLTGEPPFKHKDRRKLYDKILKGKIPQPKYATESCKNLLKRLMNRNPTARLGSGLKGPEDIKSHRFFAKVDWSTLLLKRNRAPIRPKIGKLSTDHSNFDKSFTSMPPMDSPGHLPLEGPGVDDLFSNFSFENTSISPAARDTPSFSPAL
jgi:p70 ribosomal S6 kinase